MSESDMAHGALEFGLLGAFEASRDGEGLALGGRRQRAILAMLVCEAGHAVSVERLIDGVWGEPAPSGVVTSVQSYVFHLRQVLEPDRPRGAPATVLVTEPGGYRLVADRRSVDATRFEELVTAGDAALEHGDPERAVTLYGQALSLWRGDALADLAEYEFVAPVRARLGEERAAALESRVQAELDLGHHQAVVAETGTLIADHPLRERLHAQRILALYRAGRQSDALAAYRELRAVLDTELGIEPSPPLQELNNQVLRQDPALDWRPPAHLEPARAVARPSLNPVPAVAAPRTGSPRLRLAAVGAAVAVLAGGAALPVAGAPPASAEVLPNAVSELDASGKVLASIPVGTNPVALAPGKDALWVVNAGDDNVSRINPSTRAIEQTIPVGQDPRALAVTGDDLWVTNFGDGTVSRINVPSGRPVGLVAVGGGPDAIAAGPAGLWVANSNDDTIQQIDITTGVPGPRVDVGDGPDGLTVDETSVWVANGREGSVMRIDADARVEMRAPIQVGTGPRGIVRAGDDVWVADELSQSVHRIDVATGHTESFDVGQGPAALAVLDGSVWVAEKYSGDLVRIDRVTQARKRIDFKAPVHGLAVVDGHLWVASGAFASTSHLGGTLRIAGSIIPGEWGSTDPARVYDIWSAPATRLVYDGLVAFHYSSADPQVLVPDLAIDVPEPTDSDRTYIFNLRPGIRYSTGASIRASDFVLGVLRALHPYAARHDFYWSIVGGKECTDHYPDSCDLRQGVVADDTAGRVTFHLKAPDPLFLYKLSMLVVPTPPGTPLGRSRTPVPGTGPYQIVAAEKATFTLARNPYFRQPWSVPAQPAGFVDGFTWVEVANAREAADAVQDGRADLADVFTDGDNSGDSGLLIDGLKVTARSRLHSDITLGTSFLALNSTLPPFDQLDARRAFNFAVDRRKFVDLAGGPSVAHATCQLMPPSMPSYQHYCPYTSGAPGGRYHGPDLATARALVQASGTRGMEVTVADIAGDSSALERYLAKVLRSIGYRATVRVFPKGKETDEFLSDPSNGIQVQNGGTFFADFPVPANFYDLVVCPTKYSGSPFYCDKEMDSRAAAATLLLQSEPGASLREWTRIDQELTDRAPLVPLVNFEKYWLTAARVGNYQKDGLLQSPLLSQLWVH